MPAADQPEPDKLGAVVYLSTNRPLRLPDFLAEFYKSWPLGLLEKTGKELHRAFFRCGKSDFAIEMQHTPVPQVITDRVARTTLHWPLAGEALAPHVAHLAVSTARESRGALTLACDLTRAIAALLAVTDSLAVCWLNSFALHPARKFAALAYETLNSGLYPVNLWVAVQFNAETSTLCTVGMTQFDAPEIQLSQQTDAAPLMIDYLYQVALYVLTSYHRIKSGEKIDSPHGAKTIRVQPGRDRGGIVLILEPAGQ